MICDIHHDSPDRRMYGYIWLKVIRPHFLPFFIRNQAVKFCPQKKDIHNHIEPQKEQKDGPKTAIDTCVIGESGHVYGEPEGEQ